MSEPISRPLEQSEANRLSGGDPYRLYVLASLDEIKEEQKLAARWREEHTLKDALEFLTLRTEIANIKKGDIEIRSGVTEYISDKQQVIGAKRFIVGAVFVVGAIWAVIEVVLRFLGGKS